MVDEVAWIVGDEPIFRSEIEEQYMQARSGRNAHRNDPYCVIPEQIAVQKLYLHQAKLDTIEAPEAQVAAGVDKRLNFFIANLGSERKGRGVFQQASAAASRTADGCDEDFLHYGSGAEPAHKKM